MVWEIQPGLVILDGLFTITSHPRNWRAVRRLFRFLNRVIEAYRCTVLLVNSLIPHPHRRKPSRTLTTHAAAILYMDWIQRPTPNNGPRRLERVFVGVRGTHPDPILIEYRSLPSNPDIASLHYRSE